MKTKLLFAVASCVFLIPSYALAQTPVTGASNQTITTAPPTGTGSTQVQGTVGVGNNPVGNPVYLGIYNPANGNVDKICGYASGSDGVTAGGTCLDLFGMLFNGSTFDRPFYCPNTSTFSVASTTTQVVALSGSTKIRICSASLNPSTITAGNVDIVYGTGSSCATGITTLTGAFTLPASAVVNIPIPLTAQGPLIAPAGNAVCVRTTTATVNGFITWAQF